MRDVLRAGVVVAATAVGVSLFRLSEDVPWYVLLTIGVGLCVAAGAIANRAWTMLVPFVCVLVWSVVAAVSYDPGEHGESGLGGAVIIMFILALGASACVFVGVALRRPRGEARGVGQRSDFSPQ